MGLLLARDGQRTRPPTWRRRDPAGELRGADARVVDQWIPRPLGQLYPGERAGGADPKPDLRRRRNLIGADPRREIVILQQRALDAGQVLVADLVIGGPDFRSGQRSLVGFVRDGERAQFLRALERAPHVFRRLRVLELRGLDGRRLRVRVVRQLDCVGGRAGGGGGGATWTFGSQNLSRGLPSFTISAWTKSRGTMSGSCGRLCADLTVQKMTPGSADR